jgi:hypothetical protein
MNAQSISSDLADCANTGFNTYTPACYCNGSTVYQLPCTCPTRCSLLPVPPFVQLEMCLASKGPHLTQEEGRPPTQVLKGLPKCCETVEITHALCSLASLERLNLRHLYVIL